MSMKRFLKLAVKPEWHEIEEARIEAGKYLQFLGLMTDSVHALTMVISELINPTDEAAHNHLTTQNVKLIPLSFFRQSLPDETASTWD